MKLIIAGGIDYEFTEEDYARLDDIGHHVTEIVRAVSMGVVSYPCAERWAWRWGIPVKEFPEDRAVFGDEAKSIRNQAMADYADAIAIFPGYRGTGDPVEQGKALRLYVYDMRPKEG